MHLSLPTVVGFAVLASAAIEIDIQFHSSADCSTGNAYLACTNVKENTCCGHSAALPAKSLSYNSIPLRNQVWASLWSGGNCTTWLENREIYSRVADNCLELKDGVAYTGSRYHLPSKKRAIETSGCVRPNLLSLEDGQQYDVSQLDDAQYEALTELAFNHALTDGIPDVYKSFAIPK